jgi:tripeptidyl-peptidase-1
MKPVQNTLVSLVVMMLFDLILIFTTACESYHLPEHVTPHVDFVTPTIHFDTRIQKRGQYSKISIGQPGQGSTPQTAGPISNILNQIEDCDKQITPICLRTLYGLWYEPVAGDKNSYGIGTCTSAAVRLC